MAEFNKEMLINLTIGSCISADNNNTNEERYKNIELLNSMKKFDGISKEQLEIIETGIGILEKEINND